MKFSIFSSMALLFTGTISTPALAQNEDHFGVFHISVCEIQTRIELHTMLKNTFNFPDYYGMNWDAFIDSMSDRVLESPVALHIEGINHLQKVLPREAKLMRESLADVVERYSENLIYDFTNDDCTKDHVK